MSIRLRPHHGMCFQFYEGKGYSAEFTDHMGRVIRAFSERPDTPVRLTLSADVVCERCPNNVEGICQSAEKVTRYDAAVLNACDLRDGDELPYADFAARVKERILDAGLRRRICGDCEWDAICGAADAQRSDVRLKTDRLRVRPFEKRDFADYYAYIMDPELRRMLGLDGVTDEASAKETFDWLMRNRTFLALEKKETGRVIGHVCIHPPYAALAGDPSFCEKTGCSLSFAVARGEQRKGYMEEALRGVIAALFSHGQADYIDCEYTAGNDASKTLQEKLGFVPWGTEPLAQEILVINVLERDGGEAAPF